MQHFNIRFLTSDHCLDYLWQMHFASDACTACGLYDGFHKLPKRPAYQCECGNQVYLCLMHQFTSLRLVCVHGSSLSSLWPLLALVCQPSSSSALVA